MRRYYYIYAALCLLTLNWGCIKDLDMVPQSDPDEGRTVHLSVELPYDVDMLTATKGGEQPTYTESQIHYGYLFFFDGEGALVGDYYLDPAVDVITGNGTTDLSFKIDDPAYSNSYKLIGVFNFDKTNYESDFSGLTKDNVGSYFPMNEAFLASVQNSHNATKSHLDGGGVRYDVGMPMFVNDFADSDTKVHELYRALARVSIAMASDLKIPHESHEHPISPADFSYAVVNQTVAGNIGFAKLDEFSSVNSASEKIYNGVDALAFNLPFNAYVEDADHSKDPMAYLYEYPYASSALDGTELEGDLYDPHRLSIVVAHKDTYTSKTLYYTLNLVDKVSNTYFDVQRNHDYRIVIKSVYSRGYESLEEAYLMPPSNIEYEIYDENGELTYSNGQYAISMDEILSYDNIQIYGHATTRLEFNNIRYVIPSQMAGVDVNDLTNSVLFEVGAVADQGEGGNFEVSTVLNEFESNPKLTDQGRSIVLDVKGAGSCTIKLLIKLGNLEVGRETITINKGAEDGAFDAHPCQFELEGVEVDPATWNSEDLDFGAWYDAESGNTVVYMGDNAIPTGYQTMDGYISSSTSKDAYPVFSEKVRTAYYSYTDASSTEEHPHKKKSKLVVVQLPPAYLGHFGDLASEGSVNHYNAVVAERIEEVKLVQSWGDHEVLSERNGVMEWTNVYSGNFYDPSKIYGYDQNNKLRYHNLVEGLEITEYIVNNNTSDARMPKAAHYCYYKNDVNGNGVIEADEPIEWYLPAQNQMLAMWINKTALQADPRYQLNGNEGEYIYYWSCSEVNPWAPSPGGTFDNVLATNMIEGETFANQKGSTVKAFVRCVRGVK